MGSVDWKKVGGHLLVYALGYGAIAAIQYLTKVDFGTYTPIVGLVAGAVVDTIRKNLDGVKE